MTKDMDVKIMVEGHKNEQQNVCTETSRGHHSENLPITEKQRQPHQNQLKYESTTASPAFTQSKDHSQFIQVPSH